MYKRQTVFAPSEKDRQEAERKTGFNAELPDPKGTGTVSYTHLDVYKRQAVYLPIKQYVI